MVAIFPELTKEPDSVAKLQPNLTQLIVTALANDNVDNNK
jgi:hypothetical protein